MLARSGDSAPGEHGLFMFYLVPVCSAPNLPRKSAERGRARRRSERAQRERERQLSAEVLIHGRVKKSQKRFVALPDLLPGRDGRQCGVDTVSMLELGGLSAALGEPSRSRNGG